MFGKHKRFSLTEYDEALCVVGYMEILFSSNTPKEIDRCRKKVLHWLKKLEVKLEVEIGQNRKFTKRCQCVRERIDLILKWLENGDKINRKEIKRVFPEYEDLILKLEERLIEIKKSEQCSVAFNY